MINFEIENNKGYRVGVPVCDDNTGGGGIDEVQFNQKIDNKVTDGTLASGEAVDNLTSQLENKASKTELCDLLNEDLKPLYIPTFDGSDDVLHPALAYIKNKFGGYKYYMAYTPLPSVNPYPDRWECPCIAVSNDGRVWWDRGNNPLDDLTNDEIANRDYFSDPCLLFDETKNRLEIYYRYTYGNDIQRTIFYRKYTNDGVSWSQRELVYDSSNTLGVPLSDVECVSPQVIKVGAKCRLYYMSRFKLWYTEKEDLAGNDFTAITECNIESKKDVLPPWHMGIFNDNGTFHMLAHEGKGREPNGNINYYSSENGVDFKFKGIPIKVNSDKKINKVNCLYQSVPLKVDNEWRVYATIKLEYGAKQWEASKHTICLFRGENLLQLEHIKGEFELDRSVYYNDILLANNDKTNPPRLGLRYLTYESSDGSKSYGFGMDVNNKYPTWARGSVYKNDAIMTAILEPTNPTIKPQYVGQCWINTSNKRIWMGVNTGATSDFIEVTTGLAELTNVINNGIVQNKNLRGVVGDAVIDASKTYNLTITSSNNPNITNIVNGVDKQEIIIFNSRGDSRVTLKNRANGNEGFICCKGGQDIIIGHQEAIKLVKYANYWFTL